jgi:hypothetical protein
LLLVFQRDGFVKPLQSEKSSVKNTSREIRQDEIV